MSDILEKLKVLWQNSRETMPWGACLKVGFGGRLATFVDARTHGVAELMQYAREAARDGVFLVIVGGSKVSTHDLVQITSAGQGYVSFQLEPPESTGAL